MYDTTTIVLRGKFKVLQPTLGNKKNLKLCNLTSKKLEKKASQAQSKKKQGNNKYQSGKTIKRD